MRTIGNILIALFLAAMVVFSAVGIAYLCDARKEAQEEPEEVEEIFTSEVGLIALSEMAYADAIRDSGHKNYHGDYRLFYGFTQLSAVIALYHLYDAGHMDVRAVNVGDGKYDIYSADRNIMLAPGIEDTIEAIIASTDAVIDSDYFSVHYSIKTSQAVVSCMEAAGINATVKDWWLNRDRRLERMMR